LAASIESHAAKFDDVKWDKEAEEKKNVYH
jgi:hypothetical protein